ncbi:hypothetical protein M153_7300018023 [Pseudoloma neurophilia]|uniref:Uncharacterized protein n=1 Tax=Pseudoloma neurophilia TaxID=146866 RepID=A0A0R0M0G8_9MICR|nr:hypothetical protein M153_7300018023 [Pseudoloma neurophilia]
MIRGCYPGCNIVRSVTKMSDSRSIPVYSRDKNLLKFKLNSNQLKKKFYTFK